jgi:hypothetical protein
MQTKRKMASNSAKLVQISPAEFGSILTLTNAQTVPINVRPETLDRALREYERPSLAELVAEQSLEVHSLPWQTSEQDWVRVSELILASPVATSKFQGFRSILERFGQPPAVVRELPHRVYGGLSQSLYTSHPFDFREDPTRPAPWVRALLGADGGFVFQTWVDLRSGIVEIECGVAPGHFIE